ncbi:hypothetical protein CLV91_1665 [Maribacter vaceletii]|uniref:VWA domain-containing protein n=1 Tax=Maribacter vaceletii TaxID=1206816 RepID=A0A495E8Y8_9FLAO|nr:VWA domain-containing protein [Maribacter vaceletii]RKR12953.1 hypothetical protein CLV91_1665 [Maribacter vaceletii]
MQTKTVLFIILAAVVALFLVLYQYYYKRKIKGKTIIALSFLRFVSIFTILLLLINPKFVKNKYEIVKTNLVLLVDNSSSLKKDESLVKKLLERLTTNNALKDKFVIHKYAFGKDFSPLDTLSFLEQNTNISKALLTTEDIYARTNSAVVLFTDGNQTIGQDYEHLKLKNEIPIFPICVGDTTKYSDIRIEQINSNPYSFLNNKFPVEVIVNYEGASQINKKLTIIVDGKKEYQEQISFSKNNNSKTITTNLKALSVGVKSIEVNVETLEKEKNVVNNRKIAFIEVIDETTKIGIISSIMHPDIGALKKSIEINKQREVFILKPTASSSELEKIDLFIIYQPNSSFSSIYNYIKQKQVNNFTVTGVKTDWRFLNAIQKNIKIQDNYPIQEVAPILNPSFSKFDISDFNPIDYPPLETNVGPITFNDNAESLLNMIVKGVHIDNPLCIVLDNDVTKEVFWFGENIWKWRVQEYRNSKEFKNFDDFIGKLIIYLTSSKNKDRLNIEYKPLYQGNSNSKITTTYFDESFTFDSNATIIFTVQNTNKEKKVEIPMLLKQDFFEVDLSNLSPGDYNFNVAVKDKNYSKSGTFSIKNFNVEQQFLSSNYKKMQSLADDSNGKLLFPSQISDLENALLSNKAFIPVQKRTENIVPLVDFRILLGLIIGALTLEWFIRKYKGLM